MIYNTPWLTHPTYHNTLQVSTFCAFIHRSKCSCRRVQLKRSPSATSAIIPLCSPPSARYSLASASQACGAAGRSQACGTLSRAARNSPAFRLPKTILRDITYARCITNTYLPVLHTYLLVIYLCFVQYSFLCLYNYFSFSLLNFIF